jgi:hypothetical protein
MQQHKLLPHVDNLTARAYLNTVLPDKRTPIDGIADYNHHINQQPLIS